MVMGAVRELYSWASGDYEQRRTADLKCHLMDAYADKI